MLSPYLVRFAQVRENFRLAELRGICQAEDIVFPEADVSTYNIKCPFWVAHFVGGDEAIRRILKRAVLILQIDELLAQGDSFEELIRAAHKVPTRWYDSYELLSFRFDVDDYMAKVSGAQKVSLINRFSFMPLKGPVSMNNPGVRFCIHLDATGASATSDHGLDAELGAGIRNSPAYLGRVVGEGERGPLMGRFNLKRRPYLGTTSMDAELSLVMANVAAVRSGSLVYDPFVGTGSLLCTAAAFGGLVLGSDIDGRQIRGTVGVDHRPSRCVDSRQAEEKTMGNEGQSRDEQYARSLVGNIRAYGLEERLLDALIFDIRQHPWRTDISAASSLSLSFDIILTDPPYGVRAGAKKIGTRSPYPISASAVLTAEERAIRYPKTVAYEMDELVEDLHRFAVRSLRPGGRLVYWYPTEFFALPSKGEGGKQSRTEEEVRNMLPKVLGLHLLSLLLQPCRLFDRWLLVYERRV